MLDEESLSRRLVILATWMDAMRQGKYAFTPKGAQVFTDMLTECANEARKLEFPGGAAVEAASKELAEARAHVEAAAIEVQEVSNVLAFPRPIRAAH